MAGKITYSKRPNKRRVLHDHDAAHEKDDSRKRSKADTESNESRLPTPPSSRQGRKTPFKGPVSIPDDDMYPPRSVFDKVLGNKQHRAPKPDESSIRGDRENYAEIMKTGQKSRQQNGWARNGSLPTPPAEAQRRAHEQARKDENLARYRRVADKGESQAPKTSSSTPPTQTSQLFERIIKNEQLKEPYQPRIYKAEEVVAPRRTIAGERLSRRSEQAQTFMANQVNSPLLQLPENVRSLIYTYVLGGKSINIGYESYRTIHDPTKPKKAQEVVPIFKYRCTVFGGKRNPYRAVAAEPWLKPPTTFTLLNGVCRQMYEETATLPYQLNLIAFDSYNIMFNFLFMEKRLRLAQLDALTNFMLPDELPGSNALARLRNLEIVFLGVAQEGRARGAYRVVRTEGEEPRLTKILK
ncbi:hypothetical protein G6011_06647 [Alternaria panax]|uniref:DUF7730 domain-containing protein n=1 Tax=Alternaria panax TaxID=48097 RepID=A0AAD4I9V1_9PLEO|nr:hypothetical protein G6011_06647 [Alternaria panax]